MPGTVYLEVSALGVSGGRGVSAQGVSASHLP